MLGIGDADGEYNYLKVLRGSYIRTVKHVVGQLDKNDNMIVGIHSREYCMYETVEIMGKMGYEVVRSYYYESGKSSKSFSLKTLVRDLLVKSVPSLKPFQEVIDRKAPESKHEFHYTESIL